MPTIVSTMQANLSIPVGESSLISFAYFNATTTMSSLGVSVSLTGMTPGIPVYLLLQGINTSGSFQLAGNNIAYEVHIDCYRSSDSSSITNNIPLVFQNIGTNSDGGLTIVNRYYPPSLIRFVDVSPTVTSDTWTLYSKVGYSGGGTGFINSCKLYAWQKIL